MNKPTEKMIEAGYDAFCKFSGLSNREIVERVLSAALAVEAGTDELPIELDGVEDAIAYGKGLWRSCSGCHETNEGVPLGQFSKLLKCHLGGGCFECGGIGAVWDTTDYADMGRFMEDYPPRPAAYQQFKDGKWVECSEFVAKGWANELSEGCRALYLHPALLTSPASSGVEGEAVAVPDGWRLVPVEPTREMWAAMADTLYRYKNRHHDKVAGDLFKAMLSALPAAPSISAGAGGEERG